MVKYSFVIPAFGCEKYLQSCVESVLNQTYKHDYEVIIVDDGSLDRSGEIADQLGKMYPQVRVLHKENGGAASARNRGIKEASGKYILFVDGDDTVDENLLASVNALPENDSQAMILYGISFDFYRNEKLEHSKTLSCSHEGAYSREQLLTEFQSFFLDNALSSACNKVFSAEMIRKGHLQFRDGMTLYEDFDFVLRCLKHAESITCLNLPLYHYRNDLENAHLSGRVFDLGKLRTNLSGLLESAMDLYRSQEKPETCAPLLHVSANLYMQLLIQNLMVKKYSLSELRSSLTEYCAEPNFRTILSLGAQMSAPEGKLLCRIDNREFRSIGSEFRKRRAVSKIKKMIKGLLKKSGLRR